MNSKLLVLMYFLMVNFGLFCMDKKDKNLKRKYSVYEWSADSASGDMDEQVVVHGQEKKQRISFCGARRGDRPGLTQEQISLQSNTKTRLSSSKESNTKGKSEIRFIVVPAERFAPKRVSDTQKADRQDDAERRRETSSLHDKVCSESFLRYREGSELTSEGTRLLREYYYYLDIRQQQNGQPVYFKRNDK